MLGGDPKTVRVVIADSCAAAKTARDVQADFLAPTVIIQENRRTPRPSRAQKILARGNLSLDIADQGRAKPCSLAK
jgi:hypothetical protein